MADPDDYGLSDEERAKIAADPTKYLCDLLSEANIRMTLDRRRTVRDPCWLCSTTSEPRNLVTIGHYARPMGGNLQPGDPISRPLCPRCDKLTSPT
jgi:hypothetical protein